MGTISLYLSKGNQRFRISRMILSSEMNRLPTLQAKIAVPVDSAPPALGQAYTLSMQQADGSMTNPFGLNQWFTQSIFRMPAPSDGAATEFGYVMQLAAIPGQMLKMKAYVTDNGGNFDNIINDVCSRFSTVRINSSGQSADNTLLDTVISVGETFEQFLRRMAFGGNQWFTATKGSDEMLELAWQNTLTPRGGGPLEIGNSITVAGTLASPQQVVQYWPRALYKPSQPAAATVPDKADFCVEQIDALPLKVDEAEEANNTQDGGVRKFAFILGDQPEMAPAWPGISVVADATSGATTVALSVLHLFDEDSTDGGVERLLRRGAPGLTDQDANALATQAQGYGVLIVGGANGASYAASRALLDRFGTRQLAREASRAMGFIYQGFADDDTSAPETMIATVVPWDATQSATWAPGNPGSQQAGCTTEIRVQFDWSNTSIRVPYAHPMDGADGLVFFPPKAGDRVLILLDNLWPITAINAFQYNNVAFPSEFRVNGTGDTLSAPRGALVEGGLLLRTLNNGDLVIHSAGNLILRAANNVILDGARVVEHGRRL